MLENISLLASSIQNDFFRVVDGLVEDDGWCLRNGINSINPFDTRKVYEVAYSELTRQGFFDNEEQREAILASILPGYLVS